MHERGKVLGRWENLRKEGGKWYADPVFDTEDKGLGEEIGGKVERGFINAASLGIVIQDCQYNDALNCYDVTKWALQEISIVDIGSNQNALRLYAELGGEPIDHLQLSAHLEQFKPTPTNESTPTNQLPMALELKTLAVAMGLPETATEQDVLALAASRTSEATELTNLRLQLATQRTTEATSLIDQAIEDKKIPATTKDTYLKLFAADHEAAKGVLASLTKPTNLTDFTKSGQNTQQLNLAAADAETYDKMDKAGTLLQLAQSDKPQYDRLFEAKFGKKPDKVSV
jgi:hypothetical protein